VKKVNAFKYEVAAGEVITIKATPTGVAALVAFARDGAKMTPEPGTADTTPTYVFTVNSSSIGKMEFSFPGAQATAKYDAVITGSGGGDTGGFTILQTASIKDPNIRFIVV
jgi:hypothetical protein